jgi:carbamoyl-phosphate synthase large subunit
MKVYEGRPNIVDSIINKEVDLIINTAIGKQPIQDSFSIRRTALERQIPYVTTIRGAAAVAKAIAAVKGHKLKVKPIQAYYRRKGNKK